jgi:hypothetical protein
VQVGLADEIGDSFRLKLVESVEEKGSRIFFRFGTWNLDSRPTW